MKILYVLNPSLDDYKASGAALLSINLGEYINDNFKFTNIDYVANECIKDLIKNYDNRVFCPDNLRNRYIIQDIIKYSINKFYEGNYDLIHIHVQQLSVLNSIYKFIPKDIPVVYTQHTATILGRFSLSYREYANLLSNDSDRKIKIVCPSNSMMNIWKEYINEYDNLNNVSVIRNGICTITDELELRNLKTRDYYITCGRIVPSKGILEIVKFCIKYNHKLVVIGDYGSASVKMNTESENYYNQFLDLVENNKELITHIKNTENYNVLNLISNAKAYISMSKIESFGLTIAESLSVGTPILYLEEDAISELVDNKSSVMIPKSDVYKKQFNTRLPILENYLNVLENKIQSMEITSETVKETFYNNKLSIKDCSENYIRLYLELLNGGNSYE